MRQALPIFSVFPFICTKSLANHSLATDLYASAACVGLRTLLAAVYGKRISIFSALTQTVFLLPLAPPLSTRAVLAATP